MSALSLYKLTADYRELEQLLDADEQDELTLEAIHNTLEGLAGDIRTKAQNVAAYVLNQEAMAQAARDAARKLVDRAIRSDRRTQAMREYVRVHLEAAGIRKVEGPEFTVAIRSNPPSVKIEPDAEVPEAFMVQPEPPPKRPDKTALKKALQAGTEFAGITLERSERLDIRV